jgi:hypothetical protein
MREPTRKGTGGLEVAVVLPSSHLRILFSKQINYF